jgi:hypothetical protein
MFKVQKSMCDECLFSDRKIVSDKRKKDIIKDCLHKDTHFVCHKTQTTGSKDSIACRGFYDRYPTQGIRIASRLNAIEFVEVK